MRYRRSALHDLGIGFARDSILSAIGGLISSDEVTVHWDGGCGCGPVGAFLEGTITRYTDKRGEDDRITCQRTADAVSDAIREFDVPR